MTADSRKAVDVGRLSRFLTGCRQEFAANDPMTAAELSAGTSTAGKVASPKVVADYVKGEIDDALGVVANGSY